MHLVSCTHCHRTWEHVESDEQTYPDTYVSQEPHVSVVRKWPSMPCYHKWDVEVALLSSVNVFTEVPYIATLPEALNVDFVGLLLKYINPRDRISLSDIYFDMIEVSGDILTEEHSIGGDSRYILETISYRGQEATHASYFEQEVPFYVFDLAYLRILAYLYQKNPTVFVERLQDKVKTRSDAFHQAEKTFIDAEDNLP